MNANASNHVGRQKNGGHDQSGNAFQPYPSPSDSGGERPMTDYAQLSAYRRDVLIAVGTSQQPVDGNTVTRRTAEFREETLTPDTDQVVAHLTNDGWLTRQTDETDKRVERYRLTTKATEALAHRFDLLAEEVCDSLDRRDPDDHTALRTDGGQPTDALEATLSVLVEDDTTTVSTDATAELRVRADHGQIRLEAAGQADHTTEAVLEADPQTMTALADRLYAAAATAARGGPSDG